MSFKWCNKLGSMMGTCYFSKMVHVITYFIVTICELKRTMASHACKKINNGAN